MRTLPPHVRLVLSAGLLTIVITATWACDHDWDVYLPVAGTPGGIGVGGSGVGGGPGGHPPGGQGGVPIPGICPDSGDHTPLMKVGTPANTATCVDRYEVTRGQYEQWLESAPNPPGQTGACAGNESFTPAGTWPPNGVRLQAPVASVDWCDATAFCETIGKRLCGAIGGGNLETGRYADPTASEWFNACTDRGDWDYPYGPEYEADTCNGLEHGMGDTVSVGTLSLCRSSAAVYDLSGNVWEWENSCEADGGMDDNCRIRGGGYNNAADNLLCASNSLAPRRGTTVAVGFRCCADPIL